MPDNHSNTRIKKLSPLLINQLAAGEVVTRPAAVVKELLENAIDAGSTNIEVRITQGGMGIIEVVDNGVGIHPDDMVMAITRHATSKVADVANLHGITTLGFRGEALAATAAVSRLTLTSSHDSSGIGRQLQVAGVLDDTPKMIPVVHQRGTTITVKDLYFNVPARRGNLKSIATEFGYIETIVREVALARADVALTLFHDNKKRLSLSISTMNNDNASRLPLSRLEQATGISLTEQSLEVAVDLSSLMQQPKVSLYNKNADNESVDMQASISGWLWPSNDSQHILPKLIYVNGRLVKEAIISNQLRQLAQSMQLTSMGYALYFELPTQWLNINVHPSKQRIKISPLNNIMAHLNHALRAKLNHMFKTVSSTKTVNAPRYNTQILDHRSDTSTSTNTVLPKIAPALDLRQSQQVNAPKQPYQLSETVYLTQYSEIPNFNKTLSQDKVSINTTTASYQLSSKSASLPYCLSAITELNNLALDSSIAKGIDDKMLPWLLFYNQGQCVLIGAERWQSKISSLLPLHISSDAAFSSIAFSSNVFSKETTLNNVNGINQQLMTVSAQMSAQDLQAFIAGIEALLTKHAIKTIDSSQLVALMLSSAPE